MRFKLPDNQTPDDGNMLKRRLLGAAVLIAVAVIALPLLLDGAGSESRFRRVEQLRQEPPRIMDSRAKPDSAAAPAVTKPEATVTTTESAPVPEQVAVAPTKPKTEPKPEPVKPKAAEVAPAASAATPAEPLPEPTQATVPAAAQSNAIVDQVAWVVQAGSYAAEENALALRARLRAAGFPSFVSKGSNQDAAVFRVKVGPLNNRQQAAKVQSEVESLLGQSTLIRKYP